MRHSWSFRWWFVIKLRQQLSSPFKMKNEADAIKSDCIAEIQQKSESAWLSIKKLVYQFGVKKIQNNRTRLDRNELNQQTINPDPVFSQNQISRVVKKYWMNRVVIIGFIVAEIFLYWLVASLFVPGGNQVMKISVAAFLALLIVFALDFGFTQHFLYRTLRGENDKRPEMLTKIKKQNDLRLIGYLLIAFSFAAIIFSGLARIFFLENIPQNGLSQQKYLSIKEASKWASLLTMVVTLMTGILLALIKREQSLISEQYNVLQYWRNAVEKKNSYAQLMIKHSNQIMQIVEQSIERHWQLIIEVKRILKMPQEYDEKYEELSQEYLDMKSKPGFTINDHIYRKFSPIQSAHEELFRYGIYNNSEIREKLLFVQSINRTADEYLTEQINAISNIPVQQEENIPIGLNGKTEETAFIKN